MIRAEIKNREQKSNWEYQQNQNVILCKDYNDKSLARWTKKKRGKTPILKWETKGGHYYQCYRKKENARTTVGQHTG